MVAAAQKQLKMLQWAVPGLTGALVAVSAFAGKQQCPPAVVDGLTNWPGAAAFVPTTTRRAVWIDAPTDIVAAYLCDFTTTAQWDPHTLSCRRLSDSGGLGVGAEYEGVQKIAGRATTLLNRVVEYDPGRRIVFDGGNDTIGPATRSLSTRTPAVRADHRHRHPARQGPRRAAPPARGYEEDRRRRRRPAPPPAHPYGHDHLVVMIMQCLTNRHPQSTVPDRAVAPTRPPSSRLTPPSWHRPLSRRARCVTPGTTGSDGSPRTKGCRFTWL